MMHGGEKSDPAIVATKPPNDTGSPVKEGVEPRAGTEGNATEDRTRRALDRESVSQGLDRVRQAARQDRTERFTALLHHIDLDLLRTAFFALKRGAAPRRGRGDVAGLRGEPGAPAPGSARQGPAGRLPRPAGPSELQPEKRWRPPAARDLVRRGQDRATGRGRGAERDLRGGLPRLQLRVSARAGPHDALDALCVGIVSTKVSYILDADIRSFFDMVSQDWLMRFLEHRIGDPRMLRLIRKWLRAGVVEDGVVSVGDRGTGQGSAVSPLLANVYLHYAFDLWAKRWRRREAAGNVVIVRYADDIVVGFEHEADARRFQDAMRERLAAFSLSLHPDKTRLIVFGRFAARDRQRRGLGKPDTFTFLGFTFICGKSRQGRFQVRRKSRGDRMKATLKAVKDGLRRRMHQPIPLQGRWLKQVVTGYFNYHAVPTNSGALAAFRAHIVHLWRRTLRRRSQKDASTWKRIARIADDWLPKPRILHPWPHQRFVVKHPRWEPYAGIPRTDLCGGRPVTGVPTAIERSRDWPNPRHRAIHRSGQPRPSR